jgi:predicted transcriptional regulator
MKSEQDWPWFSVPGVNVVRCLCGRRFAPTISWLEKEVDIYMSTPDNEGMRTTIRLNEELARRAKQYAQREGRTFTELVTDAVSEFIARPKKQGARKRIVLPTSGNAGGKKFTEADYRAIVDRMYEEDAERIIKGMSSK